MSCIRISRDQQSLVINGLLHGSYSKTYCKAFIAKLDLIFTGEFDDNMCPDVKLSINMIIKVNVNYVKTIVTFC